MMTETYRRETVLLLVLVGVVVSLLIQCSFYQGYCRAAAVAPAPMGVFSEPVDFRARRDAEAAGPLRGADKAISAISLALEAECVRI